MEQWYLYDDKTRIRKRIEIYQKRINTILKSNENLKKELDDLFHKLSAHENKNLNSDTKEERRKKEIQRNKWFNRRRFLKNVINNPKWAKEELESCKYTIEDLEEELKYYQNNK